MYSSLQYVTPPAVEPVPVELVRQHLRVDYEDDALLTFYATTAREQVEAFLGRALITQTLRWTMASAPPPVGYPYISPIAVIVPLWVNWPVFIRRPIELPRSPTQSVASITWTNWGQPDTLDPSQYHIDQTEPWRIRLPFFNAVEGGSLQIVFTAGYGATGAAVPASIRHALLMVTAMLYERRGDDGGELPDAAYKLLAPFRVFTFAG
ncbi:MAG: hypothetical protein JOY66_06435 [Acetobacteraceae bacterium]|nr:hypothetical protein [Acetobacteraceae bacterium]